MQNGLRPEVNRALCEQFAALYNFIFRRLVESNVRHEIGPLDEALQILEHQRESWRLLLERTSQAIESDLDDSSGPQALSVQG
jgi:flagellin-specific chaperone FliS